MKKRLVLSLLCALQTGLAQSGEFLPTAKYYFQSQHLSRPDFILSVEGLERQKTRLLSTIRENNTKLERLKGRLERNYNCTGYHHSGYYHHSTVGEHFFGSIVDFICIAALQNSEIKQIHSLESEQIKNKTELSTVEESLETAYFDQLTPSLKKKLLQSKIEAYTSESTNLAHTIPTLEKTAARKSLYSNLALASGLSFGTGAASLAFLKSNAQPYVGVFLLASFISTLGLITKAGQAKEAHKKLEDIKNKLILFKEKAAEHSANLAHINESASGK